MREHLYKAKRIDNGEWVEGFYVGETGDGCHEIYSLNHRDEIDPKTICEYTGLADEEKSKIFEGDILQDDFDEYIVTFEDGCFCASAKTTKTNLDNNACTVVGNIHNKQDREDYGLNE